jgi:hypothetical protein
VSRSGRRSRREGDALLVEGQNPGFFRDVRDGQPQVVDFLAGAFFHDSHAFAEGTMGVATFRAIAAEAAMTQKGQLSLANSLSRQNPGQH